MSMILRWTKSVVWTTTARDLTASSREEVEA